MVAKSSDVWDKDIYYDEKYIPLLPWLLLKVYFGQLISYNLSYSTYYHMVLREGPHYAIRIGCDEGASAPAQRR